MALIEWNLSLYTVEVSEFDNHHKNLVNYINDLHSAMLQGKGKEMMSSLLFKLMEYTKYHFAAEEAQMIKYAYPDYAAHKKAHDDFVHQVNDLSDKYKNGNKEITIETFKFLKTWLIEHIQGSDKAMGSYVHEKQMEEN